MVIKKAGYCDAGVIDNIERMCFEDCYSIKQIRSDLLNTSQYFIYLAYLDNLCIGYISYSVVASEAELLRIAVVPEYRAKGFGTKILQETYREILNVADKVFLEVSNRNVGARTMYKSFGFEEISVRNGYYKDGSDAIIMRKVKE